MKTLLTGASSGLGAEMARQFGARGHQLALAARRVDRLEQVRDDILAVHPDRTVRLYELDVDDHDAVFRVVHEADAALGGLDRVIVNAGIGKGAPLGTGRFDANKQTLTTNLISALAQCEAALELFRERGRGHLVVISSMSAVRGMPKSMTAYSASKAGLAAAAEGLRAEFLDTEIKITTLFPGYIRSEMNERVAQRTPLMTDTEAGVRAMVRAIDREVATAAVPAWPWRPLRAVLRYAPLSVIRRFG